jgi:diadenosine tetraphosphate (Ap4A) HIT family hydrolase
MTACPFCELAPAEVWAQGRFARAFFDRYPIADGHTLVVPTRHVGSIFALPAEERAVLWELVAEVRTRLEQTHHTEAFTIGINDGQHAGQTVAHAHVHVIPRQKGDVPDPRGGVRWVIPNRARYWAD